MLVPLTIPAHSISKGGSENPTIAQWWRERTEAAFSMKTITSFLITGLLLLTQSLEAGERGGGVGFMVPSPRSSSREAPAARAPVAQGNPARTAPHSGKNAQPGNSPQRSNTPVGQARSGQNQSQSNPLSFAAASRRTVHEMHDHNWWRQHFRIIVFAIGGFYYWDSGYWYPAWGYDPSYNNYDYDGPIYAYGNLLPDQVTAQVQTELQQDGYYFGSITGSLDTATRAAIANYQRDQGLVVTATIDQPTVESLGLA
jgi:Putative peptidoglycan binding domain